MNISLYLGRVVRLAPILTVVIATALPISNVSAQQRSRSIGSVFRELFYGEPDDALEKRRPKQKGYSLDAPPAPQQGRYDYDSFAPDPATPDYRVSPKPQAPSTRAPEPKPSTTPRRSETPATPSRRTEENAPPKPSRTSDVTPSSTPAPSEKKPFTTPRSNTAASTPKKLETSKKTDVAEVKPKITPRPSILKKEEKAPETVSTPPVKKETNSSSLATSNTAPKVGGDSVDRPKSTTESASTMTQTPSEPKKSMTSQVASSEMKLPSNTAPEPSSSKEEKSAPSSNSTNSTAPDMSQVKVGTKTNVPGRVKSPYPPYNELDVTGLPSGSLAMDPTTRKVFKIP